MFFQNLNKDVSISETESSIFSDVHVQEMSSINQVAYQDSFFTPWKSEINENNETFTPNAKQDFVALYEENLALKKKIKDLEDSLKEVSGKPKYSYQSNPTVSTGWFTSPKTSFCEEGEGLDGVRRNLMEELNESECVCIGKRSRTQSCAKHPHKFVKIAILKSIGALRF